MFQKVFLEAGGCSSGRRVKLGRYHNLAKKKKKTRNYAMSLKALKGIFKLYKKLHLQCLDVCPRRPL